MKTNIFIHIGMHKTGSTSIQRTMSRSRQTLLAHDINYLALGENHSTTLFPLFSETPHLYDPYQLRGIDTAAKAAKKNAETEVALRRELAANRCGTFVISGEDLSGLKPKALEGLKDRLAPYAASFRVIVYVRDPYSSVNSIFQHRLRRGQTVEQIIASPPRPRYRRIASAIAVFGRENVDIRIFDPAHFVNGDLIADFLAAIRAAPELAKRLDSVRSNQAVSHEAARLIGEINKRYPQGIDKSRNPGRAADIVQRLAAIPGQAARCPREVFEASEPLIAKDLAWLRTLLGEQVFPDRPTIDDVPPRWNDETLGAIAVLINDLAKAAATRRESDNVGSLMTDILRQLKSMLPVGKVGLSEK